MLNLFSPLAQSHSPTSQAAAEAIKPSANRLRDQVYAAIAAAPDGLTDEQIIDTTGIQPSTARPRRVELVEAQRIRSSERTRPTRSGRQATIWVVMAPPTDDAPAMADWFAAQGTTKLPD